MGLVPDFDMITSFSQHNTPYTNNKCLGIGNRWGRGPSPPHTNVGFLYSEFTLATPSNPMNLPTLLWCSSLISGHSHLGTMPQTHLHREQTSGGHFNWSPLGTGCMPKNSPMWPVGKERRHWGVNKHDPKHTPCMWSNSYCSSGPCIVDMV